MKSKIKIALYFSSLLAILSIVGYRVANAETKKMSSSESSFVVSNCSSIINKVNQLHVSDALMRVNRGQLYETTLTKLMTSFDKRLQNNNIDSTVTSQITSTFSTQLDQFRRDYILYEEQISNAIKLGCTNDTQSFVDSLDKARQLRAVVYLDVQSLNSTIDTYIVSFKSVKQSLLEKGIN
jgi:hypothetical protein